MLDDALVMTEQAPSAGVQFAAGPRRVKEVVLTPAAADTTLTLKDGGAGGTVRLTLFAKAGTNSIIFSSREGIAFETDVHVVLVGAASLVDIGTQPR